MSWGISLKSVSSILLILFLVISTSTISIYAHDNPEELTPIDDINQGIVPTGNNVTVKGNITQIRYYFLGSNDQIVTLSDGTGNLTFIWEDTLLEPGWIVIVKGYVNSNISVYANSVEKVLLFI